MEEILLVKELGNLGFYRYVVAALATLWAFECLCEGMFASCVFFLYSPPWEAEL